MHHRKLDLLAVRIKQEYIKSKQEKNYFLIEEICFSIEMLQEKHYNKHKNKNK